MSEARAKIALVTGASRGIGAAVADALLAAGFRVAACARDAGRLEETANALRARHPGAELLTASCDVAQAARVEHFSDVVRRTLGVPDVLVNNAGVVVRARLEETSEVEWDHVVDVGLKAAYLVTRAFLPAMRSRRSGRIVNIASISGRQGTARLTAYCAAKHGLIGLTRALAEEVRADGLQVNAVCPGSVDTDMLKGSGYAPVMTAGDVAGVVRWLAVDAPAALTGAALDVFG